MQEFVFDASLTMAWCFEDEASDLADGLLDRLQTGAQALAPSIWPLEVANVLLVAKRRGRIMEAEAAQFLDLLGGLPIEVRMASPQHILHAVRQLAEAQGLSAYDAAYLDLARQEGLPLASLDQRLRDEAGSAGVALLDV